MIKFFNYTRHLSYLEFSPFLQLFIFLLLTFFSTLLFLLIGYGAAIAIYGVDIVSPIFSGADFTDPALLGALKVLQLTQHLGLFIAPPLAFGYFFTRKPVHYLTLNIPPQIPALLIAGFCMLSLLPFINWAAEINSRIIFPDFLSPLMEWMKEKEESAGKISELFIKADTIPQLVTNLIIIAIIPALGEEFVFRGVLQRILHRSFKNIHFSILVTAILFSALHIQFLSFLPRFILGIVLGYIFFWSGNLWHSIFAHFANNGFGVLVIYLIQNRAIDLPESSPDRMGIAEGEEWMVVASCVVCFVLLFLFKKSISGKVIRKS